MAGSTYEMNRPVKKYTKVQSAKENLETKGVLVNKLTIPDLSRMIMNTVKDIEHNKARQYREKNTKQFRDSLYGMLWSDVMDSVSSECEGTGGNGKNHLIQQIQQSYSINCKLPVY